MSWWKDHGKKNGKQLHAVPAQPKQEKPKVPPPTEARVEFTEPEKMLLEQARDNLTTAKVMLADAHVQVRAAEQQRQAILESVAANSKKLEEVVTTVAAAHGIDGSDPAGSGRWIFDETGPALIRVQPPAPTVPPAAEAPSAPVAT
jgi:hypothetical protein